MRAPNDAVRIVVDGSKCDGHGICALVLPERISLDVWGYATIESDPIEDTRTLARCHGAAAPRCQPTHEREAPLRTMSATTRPSTAADSDVGGL